MDDEGSEYLCCFLAKDKRMVSCLQCFRELAVAFPTSLQLLFPCFRSYLSCSRRALWWSFRCISEQFLRLSFGYAVSLIKCFRAVSQMTTKLNFWRYLPPQAHGHTLGFMLTTPVGGFHWVPLDESPRPRQVWKRSPDLRVGFARRV